MTIFWRIVLSFWLAVTVMLAFILSDNGVWPARLIRATSPPVRPLPIALSKAVDAFEQHGAGGFMNEVQKIPAIGRTVMLFGADGRMLAPVDAPDARWAPLVSDTLKDKMPGIARYDTMIALAAPIESSSGHPYVIVLSVTKLLHPTLQRPTFWTKVAFAMVPETLICLGLALLITRPLSSLRLTARRLADGDLNARPPGAQKQRSDEIGQLARDFDAMAGRIAELLAAQRRFVASVAHELGAPLTRMQLAAALLHQDLPSAHAESLIPIERETDRLSHLVQELLFLASLEQGAIPSEALAPTSLAELCREVVRDNAAEAEEKECAIAASFEETMILAAPQTLRRAIENVLRNAIRHSLGSSSIHFSCEASSTPGFALIVIADAGPGVPEHMLSSIFQPFVRVSHRTGESTGAGLGLAIAAEAVGLHGGTITAANGKTGGLIVTIRLPLKL